MKLAQFFFAFFFTFP
ncbi:TPA: pheA operon leader peptide PheL [Salmonella enterica]|nr:pheA operon leader peptide PheL [Salmonella enterica]EJQ7236573.1 pheA operon leader peptide PheL [Salmonella enterica subsp. enterica]EJO0236200.1 pheA operon leader peptide PheL [Salmonella enterica]EKR3321164.1 pheA operon leader peptide PheL [Salmonella enterica]ELR2215030.1 pheA operon leader peptide PheL [Salmonella enterica]